MRRAYKPTALKVMISLFFWALTTIIFYMNIISTEITQSEKYVIFGWTFGMGSVAFLIYYLIHSYIKALKNNN
ncbi:MAG: hypothetical protein ABIB97_03550 [Patescibacteria group bacterium]